MIWDLMVTEVCRSKCLLISWLQSPSAVILETPKIKSDTVSPSISHEVMGPDAMIFVGHLMQRVDSLEKTLMLGGVRGRRRGDNRG